MPTSASRRILTIAAGLSALAMTASGFVLTASGAPTPAAKPTGADCLDAVEAGHPDTLRQRAFDAASRTYDVPVSVLLGVSYLGSRWDDHGRTPSTSGGYGPMHLTDLQVPDRSDGKGDGTEVDPDGAEALHLVEVAADLTRLDARTLKSDPVANICGGAAVLSTYQSDLRQPLGQVTQVGAWYDAVRRYNSTVDTAESAQFASQVFESIKFGEARTTNDGQRVVLAPHPGIRVPATTSSAEDEASIDCPVTVICEWIPAPYEWYGAPDPGAYGNHDLADRPNDLDIDYIVIHDTETSYDGTIRLVTDPTYLSWQYTLRSKDGHIAQHMDPKDVGWHAGNWYVNMHSLGLEHEGFAAEGAKWYTEAMYQTSAELVKYLAAKHDVPLDRAHIMGHDQVPAITPARIPAMHWDPGPYWDWEHYFDLLGAPIEADREGSSDVWTVAPGFDDNRQVVTGCKENGDCKDQGSNFVYVHTEPDRSSPLVSDIGLRPNGSPSTTHVSDIGARLAAGHEVVVAEHRGDWLKVWYLGEQGWVYSPSSDRAVVASDGPTVSIAPDAEAAPVYGRAYPEETAYPAEIPFQGVTPLGYTIKPGQSYALADDDVATDYYYAKTYDDSLPGDHTVVRGDERYYLIWFGHRLAYVQADDVVLSQG